MITAKLIKHSATTEGQEIKTFELEYPRFIHSEFMTHRMFSRNSASSRAIPLKAMHQQIRDAQVEPSRWGKNQPGMQAKEDLEGVHLEAVKSLWNVARKEVLHISEVMANHGAHKQIYNRITEPFMQMKVILTATEFDNWYQLRNHEDADPTIQELARKMLEAESSSTPQVLLPGEWHLPYIESTRDSQYNDEMIYYSEGTVVPLEIAKMISASCCAQVSYRKNDNSIEKAKDIYAKLINSNPRHASPVEHQATPLDMDSLWGYTHLDKYGNYWSGNFKHWVQLRQVL